MLRILCLALTVTVAAAGSMNFIDCGNKEIISVDIKGCSGETCIMHMGQTVEAQIKLTSNQNSETLVLDAYLIHWGIRYTIKGFDKNGCHSVKCPIKKGQVYVVKYIQKVPETFSVSGQVVINFNGGNGKVGCVKVNVKLVK